MNTATISPQIPPVKNMHTKIQPHTHQKNVTLSKQDFVEALAVYGYACAELSSDDIFIMHNNNNKILIRNWDNENHTHKDVLTLKLNSEHRIIRLLKQRHIQHQQIICLF